MTTFRKGDRVLIPSGDQGVVVAVTDPQWGGLVEVKFPGGNWPLSFEPGDLTPADTPEHRRAA